MVVAFKASCGLAFVAVIEKTTPRAVMIANPSVVTLPPSVAEVEVIAVAVGLVTLGATAPVSSMAKT